MYPVSYRCISTSENARFGLSAGLLPAIPNEARSLRSDASAERGICFPSLSRMPNNLRLFIRLATGYPEPPSRCYTLLLLRFGLCRVKSP